MEIKQVKTLKGSKDIIVPFKEGTPSTRSLKDLIGVSKTDFDGKFKTYALHYNSKGQRVYLLGIGGAKHKNRIHESFRHLFHSDKSKWSTIQVDLSAFKLKEVSAAVLGMSMSSYEIDRYKTDEREKDNLSVELLGKTDLSAAIDEGLLTGSTINSIKELVDAPPNVKTPAHLADWAMKSALIFGYKCKVWDEEALKKDGFGAITAVGQGSQHPPRLIVCSYLPKKGGSVDIALVGKGITFDTGGLSIKGSTNLHYMKSDMGGAAAVLGAVELAAKLNLKVNIVAVVGAAENAVDGKSYLPGDVITSYSGKTIEIIDTDAEGRLVLADALNYTIKKHNPKIVIDLATLTGSAVRTLGYSAGAMFTDNDKLAAMLHKIGDDVHERVWRLPVYEELKDDIHSDIADIRNFSMKPVAGASAAAKFLAFFTEEHKSWVHLDIAGVAYGSNSYAKLKSASGFGVRLMVEYMKKIQK